MLLARVFAERHQTGTMDLEANELALRASLHQAGATALTALLQFDPPSPNQRQLPCACGHTASYVGLRSKSLLTEVRHGIVVKLAKSFGISSRGREVCTTFCS